MSEVLRRGLGKGGIVAHYTQLVWAKTTRVGCALGKVGGQPALLPILKTRKLLEGNAFHSLYVGVENITFAYSKPCIFERTIRNDPVGS